jgi:transglutaminase-like putative cysteine protease
MVIEVIHETHFNYDAPVVESTMEMRLGPLSDAYQRVLGFALSVEPHARILSFVDGFANSVHFCSVLPIHSHLTLRAVSTIETRAMDPFQQAGQAATPLDSVDAWPYLQFHGPVDCVGAVDELADRFRVSDERDSMQCLVALMSEIHDTFEYEPAVTTVKSTVSDVLLLKKGVCQDFAHVMIAACRAMRMPARYASGYIFNDPGSKARGVGASHAWCEVFVPDLGWRGFDPTNKLVASEGHVKVAVGRDYTDVPPTRGIHRGLAEEHIDVQVSTKPVTG